MQDDAEPVHIPKALDQYANNAIAHTDQIGLPIAWPSKPIPVYQRNSIIQ